MQVTINVKKAIMILELFLQYRLRVYKLRRKLEDSITKLFQNQAKKSKSHIINLTKQKIQDEVIQQVGLFEVSDSRFATLLLEER